MSRLTGILQQESPRQRALWLGLLGLVVLWFFALIFHTPAIEGEIAEEVHGRLQTAGFQRLGVEMRGRDVLLTGKTSGDNALVWARELASGVAGVRVVHDNTSMAESSLPFLRMTRSVDGVWDIQGVLPSQHAWQRLSAELQPLWHGRLNIVPNSDPERGDAPWLGDVGWLIRQMMDLQQGRLEIGAGFVEVGGVMGDAGDHTVLVNALTDFAEKADLTLINRIALSYSITGQAAENSAN